MSIRTYPIQQWFLPIPKAVVAAFGLAFVAEAEGFEPTHGCSPPGSFQDCSLKPLEYASMFPGENKPRPGSEKNEMKRLGWLIKRGEGLKTVS